MWFKVSYCGIENELFRFLVAHIHQSVKPQFPITVVDSGVSLESAFCQLSVEFYIVVCVAFIHQCLYLCVDVALEWHVFTYSDGCIRI